MVERKELLENARKIFEKQSDKLMLMRRKKILAELKEELENIEQENLEQMLKALEVS